MEPVHITREDRLRRAARRRDRHLRRLSTGLFLAGVVAITFGSVGVVHVLERRPAAYPVAPGPPPAGPRPARVTLVEPLGFSGIDDGLVPFDAEAVRGIADTYHWDADAMRSLLRHRRQTILLEERALRPDLESIVPGSFLDSCGEDESERKRGAGADDGLPDVSAPPPATAPEPAPGLLVALGLAMLALARTARRPGHAHHSGGAISSSSTSN